MIWGRNLIIFIVAFEFISCAKKISENKVDVVFDVDSTLLLVEKKQIIANDIYFLVPKNFDELDLEMVAESKNQIIEAAKSFDPYKIYYSIEDSSVAFINDLSFINDKDFFDLYMNPENKFNANRQWLDIQKLSFFHNEIAFNQVFLQNNSFVNLKLFLQTPKKGKLSIDFFLKRNNWEKNRRSIESSIGSIKSINN